MTNESKVNGSILSPDLATEFMNLFNTRLDEFGRDFHARSRGQAQLLGRFFHCHLLLESRLEKIIKLECPNVGHKMPRPISQFENKLQFLEALVETPLQPHFAALRQVSGIRNKFAHQGSYKEVEVAELNEVRKQIPADTSKMDAMAILENFTAYFCALVAALEAGKELIDSSHVKLEKIRREHEKILDEFYK